MKYEIDEDGEKKFVAKDAVKGPSADIPKGELWIVHQVPCISYF